MPTDNQFNQIAKEAFDGLREYYPVLTEEKRTAVYEAIRGKYQDTGNDQAAYEILRDAIEAEVRHMETEHSE